MASLNGLYIPGDGRTTLLDKEFMQTINFLLQWAQDHNKEESSHFPVVATSYGFLSMLRGQLRDDEELIPMKEEQVCKPLSQNLNLMPDHTYTYDEINVKDLEKLFKPYGEVINCNIVKDNETGKSKGFGFTEMPIEIEAKNAIDKLHGSMLLSKKIRVKISNKL